MTGRCWPLLAVALALALACNGRGVGSKRGTTGGDTSRDRNLSTDDLSRELEVVILENYLQLSVGNIEAYADSISRERQVMLLGVSADDSLIGRNTAMENIDRRPLVDLPRCMAGARTKEVCLTVLSKRLDVHLYTDDSAGWLSDELSYRVPVEGRLAPIPLRVTAVFVRDIDRWFLVSEHISYGLPLPDILALARAGKLTAPKRFSTWYAERGRARQLAEQLLRRLNESEAAGRARAQSLAGKYQDAQDARDRGDEPGVVPQEAMIALMPMPRAEFHDDRSHSIKSLALMFGDDAQVEMDSYRFDMAANARVGWMIANLTVTLSDPDTGQPLRIGLRGSFLFAFDKVSGWNLTQSHISVPVTDEQLKMRVFGPLPDQTASTP